MEMDCPFCARKIAADAKTCPLCGMVLVEPEAPTQELELQSNDSPPPVTTYHEKKPRNPIQPAKPRISLVAIAGWLIVLAGLGYGGWFLYQKYFVIAEVLPKGVEPPRPPAWMLEESAKQAAAEKAQEAVSIKTPTQQVSASVQTAGGLKAAEQSLATLQEQCKMETDAIASLKGQLATEKKIYHDASSVWSLLSSAYAKLVEGVTGDPELNTAVAQLQGLERSFVAPKTVYDRGRRIYVDSGNGNSQWVIEANEWDTKYSRAERHVSEAETYLLEKLNQISKIIDEHPRHWINTDLWEFPHGGIPHPNANKPTVFLPHCNIAIWSYDRNRIGPAVNQIKEKVDALKKSPSIQAIQQQIDAKQKHLLEIGAKINDVKVAGTKEETQ